MTDFKELIAKLASGQVEVEQEPREASREMGRAFDSLIGNGPKVFAGLPGPIPPTQILESGSAEPPAGGAQRSESGPARNPQASLDGAKDRMEAMGRSVLNTGFVAVQVEGPRIAPPQVESPSTLLRQIVRHSSELREYALGGGDLGRIGVAPIEVQALRHSGGAAGRLMEAIDQYVSEAMTRHSGNLVRQGILR